MEKNVKVFFEDSGDYRRFLLRAGTHQELFKQLNEAIAQFWTESGKSFDLLYKDEENDLIKLSTPQEFEVCTTCPSNREILRIFVKRTATTTNNVAPVNNNAVVWPNVTCDKCQASPLQGIRYKCIVCADYDECASCFRKEPHAHPLLALTDPNSEEWKAWLRRRGMRGHHFGRGHGLEGGAGGPLHHHGHHHGGGGGGGPRHGGGMRRCGGPMMGGGGSDEFPPWIRAAQRLADNYLGANISSATANATTTVAGQMPPNVNFTTCDSGHPKVEVDVDMNDLLNRPESVFSTVSRAVEEVGRMFQSMAAPQQPPQQQQASVSSQTVQPVMEDKKEGTTSSSVAAVSTTQDVEMGDNNTDSVIILPAAAASTVEQKASSSSSGTQTPVRKDTTDLAPPPAGWTLLTDTNTTPRPVVSKNGIEKMVDDCIESLKELGFNTQQTWMRELVKHCEGDINRVMDELTPQVNNNNM